MQLNLQRFQEALVATERAGVQCADGLQGPEKERESEEEKKVSDRDFLLSVRISVQRLH